MSRAGDGGTLMLIAFTVLVMLLGGFVYFREGVFMACCMCVNVVLAGLVAFNFWEPLADLLDRPFAGYADVLVMVPIFGLVLLGLRLFTNYLVPASPEYPPLLQKAGGAVGGLLIGYLVGGFLVSVFQTLPWHENFAGFEPRTEGESVLRRYLPPDRAWLSLMRYAGAVPLSCARVSDPRSDSPYDVYDTFDRDGTFELRYLRYRRHGDQGGPVPYQGELEGGPETPR